MEERNRKHTPEEITGRMELMAGIFKSDAEIYRLQNEKVEKMQQLYDLEMRMYGRTSRMTDQIFEVQHCEVLNGRVREMVESEWKEREPSDVEVDNRQTGKSETVHGKLKYYQSVEKKQTDTRLKEGQKKDTPELV